MERAENGADSLVGRDIVCLGFADWNAELLTNQHHLMSRLGRANRVLFIESLGMRRPQLARQDVQRLGRRLEHGLRGVWQAGGVHVLSPLALPAHGSRAAYVANRRLLRRQVHEASARLGLTRPILWGYVPYAEALIDVLDPALVIYQCVDDLAAQKGVHAASYRALEQRFASRADLIFASAPSLVERLRRISDSVLYAPNVADIDFFGTALADGPVDSAIARLRPPRIVFTGAIVATKLDIDLLTELARSRRDWSFALVGPVGLGDPRTDISALRREPNIYLLGPRPYDALPGVLRGADAAFIPYAINGLTKSVFPMKVYEDLAAGLPVVATSLPALEDVEGVTLVDGPRAMAEALGQLIANDSPDRRRQRARLAVGHSWDDRLAEIGAAVAARTPAPRPRWSEGDLLVDLNHV
jgi:glycosyltransferase involved in cell wall biosynthesis